MPKTSSQQPRSQPRNNKKKGAKREKRSRQYIPLLRNALVDGRNQDKDVTVDVLPFMKYNRSGLDLSFEFCTNLTPASVGKWALDLTRTHMKAKYDESGYAWYDEDKREELIEHEGAARFILIREAKQEDGKPGKPVGFVHFRFTLQGEAVGIVGGEPALYVMDIQLEPQVQRKGLGRHLMRTLEMIARKQGMMHLMLPVVNKDEDTKAFCLNGLKGFVVDDFSGVWDDNGGNPAELLKEDGSFMILSKTLEAAKPLPSQESLSAAGTPAKEPSTEATPELEEVQKTLFSAEERKDEEAGAAMPAFDMTFGAANQPPPEEDDKDAKAEDLLIKQLEAYNVISSCDAPEAKTMLVELMKLFKLKNGRDPTEEEVKKWMKTIEEAVAEQDSEEEGSEEDSEEDSVEGSDEDEDDEDEDAEDA